MYSKILALLKWLGVALVLAFLTLTAVLAFTITQNGQATPDGRTMEQILGKAPGAARPADLLAMKKSEMFQLFLAADAPRLEELNGEFAAVVTRPGIMAWLAVWYTDALMGPGPWEGMAFMADGPAHGRGYNLFEGPQKGQVLRAMPMDTVVGPSGFDGRPAVHLIFARHESGISHTLHDEVRRINGRLYLGLGCLAWTGGVLNPAPFLLIGPPKPWVGLGR